jgi:hypothetical protein
MMEIKKNPSFGRLKLGFFLVIHSPYYIADCIQPFAMPDRDRLKDKPQQWYSMEVQSQQEVPNDKGKDEQG